MDFEDRLRDHLHDRTAEIHIDPEGVDVVADRVRSRRTRRTVAAAVAALAVVAGLTSFLVNQGDDTPDQVATEGIAEDTEDSSSGSDDEAADAASSALGSVPPGDLPDVVLPDPGTALVFTNVENEGSPGGYNVWQNGSTGDIYYVLSTAPGLTWEEMEQQAHFGPDTLYTFDGDRWSNSSFGDRFVTELSGGDDGILYAISTGSVAADQPAVGTSTDGGATWSWTPIDVSGQFDGGVTYDTQTYSAVHEGRQIVVVHKPFSIDWQQAIELAQSNGVDIDPETDDIFEINSEGFVWVPDVYEVNECNAAYNNYFDERFAESEEELFEPPIPYDDDLTDEEMEILRAWEEEQEQLWDERRQDAMDYMQTVPGCEEYHACMVEQFARETEIRASDESEAVFEDLIRRQEAGEEISEDEWIAAEEASASVWQEMEDWMEESGCRVILYGDFDEPDPSDMQRITWAELGVTPPESWKSSTHVYVLENGAVRDLGAQFESTGWLMTVRSTADGFEVVFDETAHELYEFSDGEEVTPTFAVWSSADGEAWTRSTSTEFGYGFDEGTLADGTTFSITWGEGDRSDLIRTNPDGSSDRLLLSDLAADLDTEGYMLHGLDSGAYGMVAWASKWDDPPRRAGGEYDYNPDSIILYSPDGQGWGATPLPGTDIADVIVGRDGVMVFLADPDFNGTETPPQPVLLGTAG